VPPYVGRCRSRHQQDPNIRLKYAGESGPFRTLDGLRQRQVSSVCHTRTVKSWLRAGLSALLPPPLRGCTQRLFGSVLTPSSGGVFFLRRNCSFELLPGDDEGQAGRLFLFYLARLGTEQRQRQSYGGRSSLLSGQQRPAWRLNPPCVLPHRLAGSNAVCISHACQERPIPL
jgi:hypothetical protein